jgi:hypothetical protein
MLFDTLRRCLVSPPEKLRRLSFNSPPRRRKQWMN